MVVVRWLLVSLLVVDVATAGAATLTATWTDNSGGLASTQIDRKRQTDASFITINTVAPGISTYVDATVSEGITYCYRVKAFSGSAESAYSETACAAPTPTTYTLTVTKSGTGSGTVASNPTGISCGSDCNEPYTVGAIVTLAATAASGSRFDGWSGGGCSGTGSCTITGNAAVGVTALFSTIPVSVPPAPTPAPAPAPGPVVTPTPTPTPTPVVTSPDPTPTTTVSAPTTTSTTTTTAADTSTTATTTTPTPTATSLMSTVQNYVTTLAPYRIVAQLKEYLEPLWTPAATAAPTPEPTPPAPTPANEVAPAPQPQPVATVMAVVPPAAPKPPLSAGARWAPLPTPTDGRTTHRLVARVTERTWIKVRMDNGQVNRETLKAGAVRQWVTNGSFLVSVGNAGAVTFELDGRPLPALGVKGAAVADVVLPSEGPQKQ